ncbi:amino acid transporter [Xaviernesmea oryzae]|uniref:Amino acid transporter n=1 Tax=Xaviernesmea oryzae TaxID=464029 RepID=A0A1Q9AVH1_9HYPH|nr:LysE family translocator [Xaviernesmea oryzae]OLP59451.1 amino acid transporter [Xaviernesmea oryzae]SEL59535.1 Threonine/homoserine/homoserine lactone efflux protein [Xaviernesmea oryzae]
MPPLDHLLAFLVTTALFAFLPGPAMLYAAARTVVGGKKAGLNAVLGIHLGAYAHIAAAAAGLSALFHAVPIAYAAVKLAGAAYLIWLGIALFRAKDEEGAAGQPQRVASARKAFAQSVMVELLNPKTAIFFLAFLPQFVDASAAFPLWLQFLLLGLLVNLIFTLADLVGVLLAGLILKGLQRSTRAKLWMRKAGGTILVGLGLHLAFQKA